MWKTTQSSWLRIFDVHVSTTSTALRSLPHGSYGGLQLNVYQSRSSDALLESIVGWMLSAESDRFWYDGVSERIMGDEGRFSVPAGPATFQSL